MIVYDQYLTATGRGVIVLEDNSGKRHTLFVGAAEDLIRDLEEAKAKLQDARLRDAAE